MTWMLEATQDGQHPLGVPGALGGATASTPLRVRAARGTVINSAFSVGLGGLGLIKSFVLAGLLSRSQYGTWGVLIITLSTLLWLKQVGIGDKYVQQAEEDQELAFQTAFTIELALSAILVVVLIAVLPLIALIDGSLSVLLPGLVLALALLVSSLESPQWIFLRRMDYGRQQLLAAADPVMGFIASIVLALLGAGYWAFVGGLAIGALCGAGAAATASPFRLRLRLHGARVRDYVGFSAPLLIASLSALVMTWTSVVATRFSLGLGAVAVITLAATLQSFTDSADAVVTGALYPAICRVRDRVALLHESFVKSNRLALMWAVPFGVGLALFSGDLVRFGLGRRWQPAVVVLELYGVAGALNHVGFNWTAYMRARGETRPMALAAMAACGFFLAVGLPLLLLFGLPGFAVGVVGQGLVAFVVRVHYVRGLFPGYAPIRHVLRAFLPTVPAAAAVLLVRLVAGGRATLSRALAELAIYLAITALATWRSERSLLRETLGLVRGRSALPVLP
jgi:O-antigen/teichoic acid export membrane protein